MLEKVAGVTAVALLAVGIAAAATRALRGSDMNAVLEGASGHRRTGALRTSIAALIALIAVAAEV